MIKLNQTLQPLDLDLEAFAAGTPATALGDSTAQANRRGMIGAVGTALEITTALQGVEADPTKIGAEYLPDTLPNVILDLADTSAMTLSNGQLGADAEGNPVVHNGVTLGGEALKYPRTRIAGSLFLSDAQLDALVAQKIGEFVCRTTDAAVGKKLRMAGQFWFRQTGSALSNWRIGISTAAQRAISGGVPSYAVITGFGGTTPDIGTTAVCQCDASWSLSDSSGLLALSATADSMPNGVRTGYVSGVLTVSDNSATVHANTKLTPATAEAIHVYIVTAATANLTAMRVSYDLEFWFE